MNKSELINYIQSIIDEQHEGVQAAFARAHGFSVAYLNDVMRERREPGQKILDAIGVEKVVVYQAKRSKPAAIYSSLES